MKRDLDIVELMGQNEGTCFEKEWECFDGKEFMDRDDFERRMQIICEIEDMEEITGEDIKNGKFFFLLSTDIRKFISPESVVDVKKRKSIPWREWDNVAQYIVLTLPDDRRLVVSNSQTFLTYKEESF
jgi:hypothetical protein